MLPSMRCKMSSNCSWLTWKNLLKLAGSSSQISGISEWKASDVSRLPSQFRSQQDLFFSFFASSLAQLLEQYWQQQSQLSDSWNILPWLKQSRSHSASCKVQTECVASYATSLIHKPTNHFPNYNHFSAWLAPPRSYVLTDRVNGQNIQVVKTCVSRHVCQNTSSEPGLKLHLGLHVRVSVSASVNIFGSPVIDRHGVSPCASIRVSVRVHESEWLHVGL